MKDRIPAYNRYRAGKATRYKVQRHELSAKSEFKMGLEACSLEKFMRSAPSRTSESVLPINRVKVALITDLCAEKEIVSEEKEIVSE